MNLWYFQCRSVTAQKVPRWFCDSPGIMHPWLVWWMWCRHGYVVEGLWGLEGVNISKGRVRAESMEWSHMAAENIGEQRRMLVMRFYVTASTSHTASRLCIAVAASTASIPQQIFACWRRLLVELASPLSRNQTTLWLLCPLHLPAAHAKMWQWWPSLYLIWGVFKKIHIQVMTVSLTCVL